MYIVRFTFENEDQNDPKNIMLEDLPRHGDIIHVDGKTCKIVRIQNEWELVNGNTYKLVMNTILRVNARA